MGCCKKGQNMETILENNDNEALGGGQLVLKYILKVFGFLILLLTLPIINLVIIWYMFSMLVLNKNIDVKPLLLAIGAKFKPEDKDVDDNDELEVLTTEDVILMDVEDVTNLSKDVK